MKKFILLNGLCILFLCGCGFAQPGHALSEQMQPEQTEINGVESFFLAVSEANKIDVRNGENAKKVVVTNPTLNFRGNETISLDFKIIKQSLTGINKDNVAVFDCGTNQCLVSQIVKDNENSELLFQTDFAPGQKKHFWIIKQPSTLPKPESKFTTYCRFIPERKDDFGWENDKVAFRMYGPALEYETITCGIDAFGKSVGYPVIEKMLTTKGYDYHKDHGEGGDFYKVGNTLGCGGAALFIEGKIYLPPKNFSDWKIIANGPIRSIFELSYAPWKAGSITVSETKRISIDLGSNLNKIECRYSSDAQDIPVAAGIVLRKKSNEVFSEHENVIAYWLPADGNNGNIGCGVVYGASINADVIQADGHLLMRTIHKTIEPFVYYSGACWDRNEEFSSFEKWKSYLKDFKKGIDNPLKIRFSD